MIKINLLKTFLAVEHTEGFALPDDERQQIVTAFAKRSLVVLLTPLALYFYEDFKKPELQKEIANLNIRISDLRQFNDRKKNLAEEIKKYEEDQKKLNGQMSFMRKISIEKVNELNLFLYLQDTIPESVWINRLELKGTNLTLTAESDVQTDINKFIDRLAATPLLTAVSPTNQESRNDTVVPGVATTVFNVKASVATGVDVL